MTTAVPTVGRLPWPWRSARCGWIVTVVALVAGVPPYLRMPPWCDLTLYDVAARNLLRGGVHYRDVFDTNPPGFVWSMVGVRTLLGNSVEAVRAVDLVMVAATVALLGRWVRLAGGCPAATAWMAAGAALFYPFISEFNHCQRDVWMMLPVVGVGLMRLKRIGRDERGWRYGASAFLEGFVLGLGAWLKPHALIPAAAVWLVTLPCLADGCWRRAVTDFLGNLVGGLTALGLGVAWLVGSGAWPWFVEVFTFWNPGYVQLVVGELWLRWPEQFAYFPPWSLFQPVALVLAAVALGRGWRVLVGRVSTAPPAGSPGAGRAVETTRSIQDVATVTLAVLFLVWTGQGLFLQRGFQYVHVPETLLMLAVFAAHGYSAGFAGVVAGAVASGVVAAADPSAVQYFRESAPPAVGRALTRHPLADSDRSAWWPACWRAELTPHEYRERRNAVGFQVRYFAGIDWVQLGEVADFLAARQARDGEVIAWHDSPHALYLLLDVRPAIRFMHVSTVTGIGEPQYGRVRDELHAAADPATTRVRWVVADLERVFDGGLTEQAEAMSEPGPSPDDMLPPAVKGWFPRLASQFPFDQPTVFRSANGRGRYVVFRLSHPVTPQCRIPLGLGEDLPDHGDD